MENSVDRILQIALAAQEAQKVNAGQPARMGWQLILAADDDWDLLSKLGKLSNQIVSTAAAVAIIDSEQQESVKHWQNQILRMLKPEVLNSPCRDVFNLDNHSINYLKAHARIIRYESKEPSLSASAIDEIEKNIAAAMEMLLESNLDNLIKANLSKKMADILESIRDYKIYGFPEVFDHVNSLAGQIALLPETQKTILRDSEASKKIWTVFKFVSDAVATTSGLTALCTDIQQLFIGK
jgi:hypothetical protein